MGRAAVALTLLLAVLHLMAAETTPVPPLPTAVAVCELLGKDINGTLELKVETLPKSDNTEQANTRMKRLTVSGILEDRTAREERQYKRALHIHTYGNLSDSMAGTGAHFDVEHVELKHVHSCKFDSIRSHTGDLGNVEFKCADDGPCIANVLLQATGADFHVDEAVTSLLGRSLVLHENEDKCIGGPTFGSPVAHCVIGRVPFNAGTGANRESYAAVHSGDAFAHLTTAFNVGDHVDGYKDLTGYVRILETHQPWEEVRLVVKLSNLPRGDYELRAFTHGYMNSTYRPGKNNANQYFPVDGETLVFFSIEEDGESFFNNSIKMDSQVLYGTRPRYCENDPQQRCVTKASLLGGIVGLFEDDSVEIPHGHNSRQAGEDVPLEQLLVAIGRFGLTAPHDDNVDEEAHTKEEEEEEEEGPPAAPQQTTKPLPTTEPPTTEPPTTEPPTIEPPTTVPPTTVPPTTDPPTTSPPKTAAPTTNPPTTVPPTAVPTTVPPGSVTEGPTIPQVPDTQIDSSFGVSGMTMGILMAAIVLLGILLFLWRRKRERDRYTRQVNMEDNDIEMLGRGTSRGGPGARRVEFGF